MLTGKPLFGDMATLWDLENELCGKEKMEEWKEYEVPCYGLIYVSNYGKIKNKKLKDMKYKKDSDGYFYIRVHFERYRNLMKQNKKYMFQRRVHRLVAELFCDNKEKYKEVNHKDGIKTNNHSENLEWCSRSYNIQHAFDNGLKVGSAGSKNGRARLTDEKVKNIRLDFKNGLNKSEISRKYNIGWTTVKHILDYDTWKNI